ncbi:hypothetical protein R69608_05547 [Paraburkholderia nemoris]|uniref:HNH endonuclease n=1 Tax=Paraburkholderia nemoris TaxID=2793076 RepID=UPI00191452E7|nr:HNH endonuclease [Burkholderia sp. R-69608]CAE6946422.1 hypothetical protein R69608_05547 [Paraburkholderia nemoris]
MQPSNKIFNVAHEEAFRQLGALPPGQHWSAFDVRREQASKKATRFVTTIWNYHSTRDERGHRTPTVLAICQDLNDATFWYLVPKPPKGTARKTWVAHWNGLTLALKLGVPIVGVLKDVATGACSLEHVFDCSRAIPSTDGRALWLELVPRGTVGAPTRSIDIRQLVMDGKELTSGHQIQEQFESEVQQAAQSSSAQRRARLALASRHPKRILVTTWSFQRNADVVAEVLYRAKGICEGCGTPAPFLRRTDGSPYLEVHHHVQLAHGGEDTVDNAVALCPNCHRAMHFA